MVRILKFKKTFDLHLSFFDKFLHFKSIFWYSPNLHTPLQNLEKSVKRLDIRELKSEKNCNGKTCVNLQIRREMIVPPLEIELQKREKEKTSFHHHYHDDFIAITNIKFDDFEEWRDRRDECERLPRADVR